MKKVLLALHCFINSNACLKTKNSTMSCLLLQLRWFEILNGDRGEVLTGCSGSSCWRLLSGQVEGKLVVVNLITFVLDTPDG